MPVEHVKEFACPGIPDTDRLVVRRGGDPLAVGTEDGGIDPAAVPREDFERLARLDVPNSGGVVARGGDDERPVGAEGR
jgi:hypothetical protein